MTNQFHFGKLKIGIGEKPFLIFLVANGDIFIT
jgi:hypothetical protein